MNTFQNTIQQLLAATVRKHVKLGNLRVATHNFQDVHEAQMALRNVFTRKQKEQGKLLQEACMAEQELKADLEACYAQLNEIDIIRDHNMITLQAAVLSCYDQTQRLQQQHSKMMTRQIEMFQHFQADSFGVGEKCCFCLEDVRIGMHLVRLDCNNVFCINCIW